MGNGLIDLLLDASDRGVPVFVSVPVNERNILRGNLDKASSLLDKPPRQQATAAETPRVITLHRLLGIASQVEGMFLFRLKQPMSRVHRAEH